MQLNFTITRTDFRNYNLHYHLVKNLRKRIFSVLLFYLLLFLYVNYRDPNFDVFIFSMILIGYGIFYFFAFFITAFLSARRLRENSPYLGEKTITFNETGFNCSDKFGTADMNYSAFQNYHESKNYFYLYLEFNQAIAIPKRCFSSFDDQKKFIEFIKPKIGK